VSVNLEDLLGRLGQARRDLLDIRKRRASFQCERERDTAQSRACWVASFVPEVRGDYGRVEAEAYWDHAGGNADDGENHHLYWCQPCQERERLRGAWSKAKGRYGALKATVTRVAMRLAAAQESRP